VEEGLGSLGEEEEEDEEEEEEGGKEEEGGELVVLGSLSCRSSWHHFLGYYDVCVCMPGEG
jgi:hypothetical protein